MNKGVRVAIVLGLVAVVGLVMAMKEPSGPSKADERPSDSPSTASVDQSPQQAGVPRLLELGSVSCVPCKMMEPILEELRQEYAGRLRVDFIDVWKDADAARKHSVRVIPTQVFFDASGEEVFRHEGFFPKEAILAKWKELGVDLAAEETTAFQRLTPARPDTRSAEAICYMCEEDIDAQTLVVVRTDKGAVRLCSPHCYFIMYSCLTEDTAGFEQRVSVTDYATGQAVPAADAAYVEGLDAQSGRPWIRAYADHAEALNAQKTSGDYILSFDFLRDRELTHRCGFCDRACYPQDAAEVIAGGVRTWGCCSHCAVGVAARTGLDIEVRQPDRLTGEMVVVKTLNGSVASLEPASAVAWFGLRQKADGQWTSAGCFHQGFFANEENLRAWVEHNPLATGRMITIQQVLAGKMEMTPQQVAKACKIGECAPR